MRRTDLEFQQRCADAKSRIDLRTIIARDLGLTPRGGLLEARCPFHQERTPSFKVWADHFYCFGCGVSGTVFDWLQSDHGGSYDARGAYFQTMALAGFAESVSTHSAPPRLEPKPLESARLEPWMLALVQGAQTALSARTTAAARDVWAYVKTRRLEDVAERLGFGAVDWASLQRALELGAPRRVKAWYRRLLLVFWSGQQPVWFKVRLVNSTNSTGVDRQAPRYDGPSVGSGVLPAPYNADSLANRGEVVLVEGELNAAALVQALGSAPVLGLPGGRLPQPWLSHLRDRSCLILTDDDEAGRKHAEDLEVTLGRATIPSRRITLRRDGEPNLDANDVLVRFGGETLRQRIFGGGSPWK
jgi:DNA primase